MTVFSADDTRYFLAIFRTGRLTLAAKSLGVDHTTVGRRIATLEQALGHRLFDRSADGWLITEFGQHLVEPAEEIERAMLNIGAFVERPQSGLSGTVRLVCPDAFGTFLLAPALADLRLTHPDLRIEVVMNSVGMRESVLDFDVGVTLEEPRSSKVIMRPLSKYTVGLYASRDYLSQHGPIEDVTDLETHRLIWYVDRLLNVQSMHVLGNLGARPANIQMSNVVAHWQAAANGAGVAPLARYIASRDSRLVRVLPEISFEQDYWLVIPREHRRWARVALMVELLEAVVADRVGDLVGIRRPKAAPSPGGWYG